MNEIRKAILTAHAAGVSLEDITQAVTEALTPPQLRDYADYERAVAAQQGYGMRTKYREPLE